MKARGRAKVLASLEGVAERDQARAAVRHVRQRYYQIRQRLGFAKRQRRFERVW